MTPCVDAGFTGLHYRVRRNSGRADSVRVLERLGLSWYVRIATSLCGIAELR
jgi:hypothetical protein